MRISLSNFKRTLLVCRWLITLILSCDYRPVTVSSPVCSGREGVKGMSCHDFKKVS